MPKGKNRKSASLEQPEKLADLKEEEKNLFLDAIDSLGEKEPSIEESIDKNASPEEAQLFLEFVEKEDLPAADPGPEDETENSSPKRSRTHRKGFSSENSLDLHGFRAEMAHSCLIKFLEDSFNRGLRRLLVIHGKGSGVLRDIALQTLKSNEKVLSFHTAPPRFGGDGALVVLLRS